MTPPTDQAPPTESDAVRENRHALYRKIDGIEHKVNEVHLALVGNPNLGNVGLVKRVEHIEEVVKECVSRAEFKTISEKVENHERKLWFGMTLLSAIWAAIVAFKEKIFH